MKQSQFGKPTGSNTPAPAIQTSGTSPYFSSLVGTSFCSWSHLVTSHGWKINRSEPALATKASASGVNLRSPIMILAPREWAICTYEREIPEIVSRMIKLDKWAVRSKKVSLGTRATTGDNHDFVFQRAVCLCIQNHLKSFSIVRGCGENGRSLVI